MRGVVVAVLLAAVLLPAPVAARGFEDLRIDVAAAPWRAVQTVSRWHPLADARSALTRGVAAWDEFAFRVSETAALWWGRVALGSIEVADAADRAAAAFIRGAFARPSLPRSDARALPPAAPRQDEEPTPGDARWVDDIESLISENLSRP